MEETERRQHRRVTLEGESPLLVEMVLESDTIRGRVRDLSPAGLCVVLPPGLAVPSGAWLGNVVLIPRDREPYHLRVVAVEDCRTDDDGNRVLRLTATDEQARAGLWLMLDRILSGGLTLAGDEPDEQLMPRPVPKRGVYTEQARLERLDFARRATRAPLPSLQETKLRAERLKLVDLTAR